MRGFNEKLFGDKLVAGQLPTQLGLIGSVEFGIDPDAQAFFDRVTAAGGTLSATEKTAVDTLVKQMKLDGTWTPMKAIYPMVGASAAACAQNLKSASFTGTFNGGWTFTSGGITPNGTNAYMDTNLIPSTSLLLNSVHFSNYLPVFGTSQGSDIGVVDTSSNGLYAFYRNSGVAFLRTNDQSNTFANDQTTNNGFRIVSRESAVLSKSYVNNTDTFTSVSVSDGLPIFSIFLGARSANGGINNPSNRQQSFASIGDGLIDTQASNFYTAVQAFQTTLSRQV
jgi:hypothetical protein